VPGTRASCPSSFLRRMVELVRADPATDDRAPHDLVSAQLHRPGPNRTQAAEINLRAPREGCCTSPPYWTSSPAASSAGLWPSPAHRTGPSTTRDGRSEPTSRAPACCPSQRPWMSYTSFRFGQRCSSRLRPSTATVGPASCAVTRASSATLNASCSPSPLQTRAQPRSHLRLIEGFYNTRHCHSATSMLSPRPRQRQPASSRPLPSLPDRKTRICLPNRSTSVRTKLDSNGTLFPRVPSMPPVDYRAGAQNGATTPLTSNDGAPSPVAVSPSSGGVLNPSLMTALAAYSQTHAESRTVQRTLRPVVTLLFVTGTPSEPHQPDLARPGSRDRSPI